jgi:hypothetical protein
MHVPWLEPGNPQTALLAVILGVLAVRKAYQHSPQAGRLAFMFASGVFARWCSSLQSTDGLDDGEAAQTACS